MQKIEDVKSPVIGETYLVKCCQRKANRHQSYPFVWLPVIGTLHNDHEFGLDKPHYHIDWRFMKDKMIRDQNMVYGNRFYGEKNKYFFAPVMGEEVLQERYIPMIYMRHFEEFPKDSFQGLVEEFKKNGKKMKNMICPHQGTKLHNCRTVGGIVECPCHGLKWNVKTGELAN